MIGGYLRIPPSNSQTMKDGKEGRSVWGGGDPYL